ncbi:MAG TPA: hypothetical protein VF088_07065 [Pyrinomonadaceae bacterium]
MTQEDKLVRFLRSEIEPISDGYSKKAYRASAYLRDGTYLPCVVFRQMSDIVELAIRRIADTKSEKEEDWYNYQMVIRSFVATTNRVAFYDVARIEKSPYALPVSILKKVLEAGETHMSWISFVGVMNDSKQFDFGSTYHVEFFDMPEGYTAECIVDVIPHRSVGSQMFREKPYFNCFVDAYWS